MYLPVLKKLSKKIFKKTSKQNIIDLCRTILSKPGVEESKIVSSNTFEGAKTAFTDERKFNDIKDTIDLPLGISTD